MPAPSAPTNFVVDATTKILTFDEPDAFDTIAVRMSPGLPDNTFMGMQVLNQSTPSFNLDDVLFASNGTHLVEHQTYRIEITLQDGGNGGFSGQEWTAVGEATPYPSTGGLDFTTQNSTFTVVADVPGAFNVDNLDLAASYLEASLGTWPLTELDFTVAEDGQSYSLRIPFDAFSTTTLTFVGTSTAPGSHTSQFGGVNLIFPQPLDTPASAWDAAGARFVLDQPPMVVVLEGALPPWMHNPARDIRLTFEDSHGVQHNVVSPGTEAVGAGTVEDYSAMFGFRFRLVDGQDYGPVVAGAHVWSSGDPQPTNYTPFATPPPPPPHPRGRMVGAKDRLHIIGPGGRGALSHPEYTEAQYQAEGGDAMPGGSTPRSLAPSVPAWATGVHYEPGQMLVSPNGVLTVCALAHDSTDYDADLTAGNWAESGGGGGGGGGGGTVAPVAVVGTNNEVTVSPPSGAATVDGYNVVTGDRVLLAQGDADGGVWVANTDGSWTRPADWASGAAIPDGTLVPVAYGPGSTFYGSLWQVEGAIAAVDGSSASFTCLAAYNGWTVTPNNGNMALTGSSGTPVFPQLPSADPAVAGQLWNNGGVVTVSAG